MSSELLAALARPKERENVLRLEAELTRLCNDPSQQRLEMQPMSAQNQKLVQSVAERFGLQFAVSEEAPGMAPGASADDKRPVVLTKCAETHVPTERLAEKVPAPDKVQLMRRPEGGPNGKGAKALAVHDPADEQARVKQREDAYEAARQRIFGGAQPDAGVVLSSEPPAAVNAPTNGTEQTRQAEAPSSEAPKPSASKQQSAYNSMAQRAQDAMDPAYSRGVVQWGPAAPAGPPGMPYPGAMHYGYPEAAAMQGGYHGNGHDAPQASAAPRYSQYASWGMQPQPSARALAQTESAFSQLAMRQQQLQQAVAALPTLTPEQQAVARPQLIALHQRQQVEHAQLLELQRSQTAALQAANPG